MSELLIAGNSQLGVLRSAYQKDKDALLGRCNVTFFATPGGSGPYMKVDGDRLVTTERAAQHRSFWSPAEASQRSINSFDAIVVSALGFIDGCTADLPAVARVRLSKFEPLDRETAPFVSEACFRELVAAALGMQPGFIFLRDLRSAYTGEVIVQPFPYHPIGVASRSGWRLATRYRNPVGLYKLLSEIKDNYLEDVCSELGVTLLDYPFPNLRGAMFTPEDLVDERDFLHPNERYGAAVLRQVGDVLKEGRGGF